jgi:hypothetical protein
VFSLAITYVELVTGRDPKYDNSEKGEGDHTWMTQDGCKHTVPQPLALECSLLELITPDWIGSPSPGNCMSEQVRMVVLLLYLAGVLYLNTPEAGFIPDTLPEVGGPATTWSLSGMPFCRPSKTTVCHVLQPEQSACALRSLPGEVHAWLEARCWMPEEDGSRMQV